MRKVIAVLAVASFVVTGFFITACGKGMTNIGGYPTVVSVTDANGTTVDNTGKSGIYPTRFDIKFSEPMSNQYVEAAGNIVLNCTLPDGSILSQPTINIEPSTTVTNGYALTVTDPWKYALLACTLTITKNVKDAGGRNMADDAYYTFTNACAINDDFNAESINDKSTTCWSIEADNSSWATWSAVVADGVMSFDTANSLLKTDFTDNSGKMMTLYKSVTFGEDFVLEIYFRSASGWVHLPPGDTPSVATLVISDAAGQKQYIVGIMHAVGEQSCGILLNDKSVPPFYSVVYYSECSDTTKGYYIKLTKSGTTFSRQYKEEGGEYVEMTNNTGDWRDLEVSGEGIISLYFNSPDGGGGEVAETGYIYTEGLTSTNQY